MLRKGTTNDGEKGGRKGASSGLYGLYRVSGLAGVLEELLCSRIIVTH